jgi:hypothetical protein
MPSNNVPHPEQRHGEARARVEGRRFSMQRIVWRASVGAPPANAQFVFGAVFSFCGLASACASVVMKSDNRPR